MPLTVLWWMFSPTTKRQGGRSSHNESLDADEKRCFLTMRKSRIYPHRLRMTVCMHCAPDRLYMYCAHVGHAEPMDIFLVHTNIAA